MRKYLIDLCEYPFSLIHFLFNEFKALIFFHYNFLENKRLNEELSLLKQEVSDYKECCQENKRLKNILSFKQVSPFNFIIAKVIMRSADNWLSSVVIDRGRKDRVRENLPVISHAGLVGRVIEVGDSTAKVVLLTDTGFCVSAIIQRNREEGVVCGTLDGYLIMHYLDDVSDIKIKDTVITAGLTEIFPKGILIGEVIEIKRDSLDGRPYLKIKPSVNFYKLEEVMVIIK
ncbi:MAG: rod shape-determining protein MreC [Candidatus Omnitrophica bacterium]|nr:rod shape-determining protein MreC [Candidatus Omnitrophota bacterium]